MDIDVKRYVIVKINVRLVKKFPNTLVIAAKKLKHVDVLKPIGNAKMFVYLIVLFIMFLLKLIYIIRFIVIIDLWQSV